MILGNPYKFSIFIKTIKEWNIDDTFCNGVLLFSIDGNIFPKQILTVTLKSEIKPLKEKLKNIIVNKKIFNMQKDAAFVEAYNMVFPENVDLNGNCCLDISPEIFSDNDCYVFAIGNGEEIRIMAANLNYVLKDSRHELSNINVSEAFITKEELNEIVSQLDIY